MITRQHGRPTGPRSPEHWTALLDGFRRTRTAAPGEHGRSAAVLGHEIALGAPAALAAALFDPVAGPGAAGERDGWVGPLWEVLARRHTWAVLAPLPLPAPVRTLVAHTRVLLGDRLAQDQQGLTGDQHRAGPAPLDLHPWETAGWEPAARVTVYGRDGRAATAHYPLPDSREGLAPMPLPPPARPLPGPVRPATAALAALGDWLDARCTMGTAPQAAALLCPAARTGPVTAGYLPFAAAYPALVRVGSGVGAHGRSQGAARGRLAVWRVLAAMADPLGRCGPAEVDALVARMRCFTWCEPADEIWHLHLALEDPASGLAWAVSGRDDG
ncbi:hypothetical protein [Kitasatospora viridis]|uniref:Uncharacterized protein n=1 Tax=Kitasatospora viridis TaxID=281105 RepID=A0A561UB60_9ACTN|nr:hypothetical protein [Kitasatospora viridis]TWF96601.1 hypothetical protein FHX73_11373 [Kitasatospora viridis]